MFRISFHMSFRTDNNALAAEGCALVNSKRMWRKVEAIANAHRLRKLPKLSEFGCL